MSMTSKQWFPFSLWLFGLFVQKISPPDWLFNAEIALINKRFIES